MSHYMTYRLHDVFTYADITSMKAHLEDGHEDYVTLGFSIRRTNHEFLIGAEDLDAAVDRAIEIIHRDNAETDRLVIGLYDLGIDYEDIIRLTGVQTVEDIEETREFAAFAARYEEIDPEDESDDFWRGVQWARDQANESDRIRHEVEHADHQDEIIRANPVVNPFDPDRISELDAIPASYFAPTTAAVAESFRDRFSDEHEGYDGC